MGIRVILCDDHPIVRHGLRSVIEKKDSDIKIIGEASNGYEAIDMARKSPADLYILDITLPLLNGIATTQRLIKMDPKSRIIILSIHESQLFVENALKSGARGYLIKESAIEEITLAIREVFEGRYYLSPSISKYLVDGFLRSLRLGDKGKKSSALTGRQMEIVQLLAEGLSTKEIARKLYLSTYTVEVHKKNAMRELDLHRKADLIRYAIREGLSKP
jgi:DNA-binding NarL/FixJ family response regulator